MGPVRTPTSKQANKQTQGRKHVLNPRAVAVGVRNIYCDPNRFGVRASYFGSEPLAAALHSSTLYIMSVTMLAETAGNGLSRKHIVETYGHEDLGSLALAALYRRANRMVDYRIGHVSYEALYMCLGSLATAITLILDAQNTGQLFCAGVYAEFYAEITVEAEKLLLCLKTLLNPECSGIVRAAITVYNWFRQPSNIRWLWKFLGCKGPNAFYVASHNAKKLWNYMSKYKITEHEFVVMCYDAVLGERL